MRVSGRSPPAMRSPARAIASAAPGYGHAAWCQLSSLFLSCLGRHFCKYPVKSPTFVITPCFKPIMHHVTRIKVQSNDRLTWIHTCNGDTSQQVIAITYLVTSVSDCSLLCLIIPCA